MKDLDLYEVLRYALAGVVGLLGLVALCPDARSLFGTETSLSEAAFVGAIALTWGTVIYAIHRAAVYPLLYRVVLIPYLWNAGLRWKLLVPYWSWPEELARDRNRWGSADSPEKTGLREWAAQVHFLYCSALALLSARGLTFVFCCQHENSGSFP